jgi:hypothetical protein
MATYSTTSPYYTTESFGNFLDVMTNRPIPADASDSIITISSVYHYRPDLLAFDLYEDSRLWWVFASRNPDILEDPVFDFSAGTQIYISSKNVINTALGL